MAKSFSLLYLLGLDLCLLLSFLILGVAALSLSLSLWLGLGCLYVCAGIDSEHAAYSNR